MINAGADAGSWRACCCCSDAPRKRSAPTAASATCGGPGGGPSLEIEEIDYAEVLREKQGEAATIDQILAAAMAEPELWWTTRRWRCSSTSSAIRSGSKS